MFQLLEEIYCYKNIKTLTEPTVSRVALNTVITRKEHQFIIGALCIRIGAIPSTEMTTQANMILCKLSDC